MKNNSKHLTEFFNMAEEETSDETINSPSTEMNAETLFTEAEKITQALPAVKNLDKSENELDAISDKARQTFEDLLSLGMSVEPRYSGRIFEVASTLLKISLDAATAKSDIKLKMVELQLKNRKLEQDDDSDKTPGTTSNTIIFDRNDLIETIINKTTKG